MYIFLYFCRCLRLMIYVRCCGWPALMGDCQPLRTAIAVIILFSWNVTGSVNKLSVCLSVCVLAMKSWSVLRWRHETPRRSLTRWYRPTRRWSHPRARWNWPRPPRLTDCPTRRTSSVFLDSMWTRPTGFPTPYVRLFNSSLYTLLGLVLVNS